MTKKDAPKTVDLRDRLKTLLKTELERLPEMLDGLETKERLSIVVKLMPLVLPKPDSVHYNFGETGWD